MLLDTHEQCSVHCVLNYSENGHENDYVCKKQDLTPLPDVTDPRNNVRRVTFHASGYCATNTNAFGTPKAQTTTFVRDATSGLMQSKTDTLSQQTTYTYDSLGNMKTMTRLAGTPQAVTDTFTYTADWNQVKTYTDPLNHVTTFGYDEWGQLTSIANHLGHTTQITYNGAGQPLTITDCESCMGSDTFTNLTSDLRASFALVVTTSLQSRNTQLANPDGQLAIVGNALRICRSVVSRGTRTSFARVTNSQSYAEQPDCAARLST